MNALISDIDPLARSWRLSLLALETRDGRFFARVMYRLIPKCKED